MSRTMFCFCLSVILCVPWVTDSAVFAHALAAACDLGRILPHDPRAAFRWYLKAAAQGDSSAAFILGVRYYEGDMVPADPRAAFLWWNRAADMGNADAQAALGDSYCLGIGVFPSVREARYWWHLSQQQGGILAGLRLATDDCTRLPAIVRTHGMRQI